MPTLETPVLYDLPKIDKDLATCLEKYSTAIQTAFTKAHGDATAAQGDLTDEQFETKRTKAKGQMLAALQQLEQAAEMLSAQRRRAGFDAVVTLMEKTTDLASHATTKLRDTYVNATPTTSLTNLVDILAKLGPLSPKAVWEPTGEP